MTWRLFGKTETKCVFQTHFLCESLSEVLSSIFVLCMQHRWRSKPGWRSRHFTEYVISKITDCWFSIRTGLTLMCSRAVLNLFRRFSFRPFSYRSPFPLFLRRADAFEERSIQTAEKDLLNWLNRQNPAAEHSRHRATCQGNIYTSQE